MVCSPAHAHLVRHIPRVSPVLRYVQRNMSDMNRVSDWCCDLPVIGQWSHMWLDSVSHALINGPCLHRHGQWLRGYSYLLLVVSSDKWCAMPPMCALCAWCHPYIKPYVMKLYFSSHFSIPLYSSKYKFKESYLAFGLMV